MKIKKIVIPKGTIIPSTFNADWNTYLPFVPNTLCTYCNTSTPNKTTTSLFNFFVDSTYPGTIVYDKNNTNTLFEINRKTNTVELGSLNFTTATDAVRVGGSILGLYSKLNFTFISENYSSILTLLFNAIKFTNASDINQKIYIPYGFNCYVNTKIQYDSTVAKYVNVPEYLEIITPNPMTDADPKKINIPYGLNMGLSNTELSVYDDDETTYIIIPKGTIIPSTFNTDWNTYLPVVPNTLCTFSTGNVVKTLNSLFNFLTDSDGSNPRIIAYDKDNTNILLKINKTDSIIQLGSGNSQLTINKVNDSLILGSSSNFNGTVVKINADELNIYINKIKFYIGSLSNWTVFSSSLSGIKYSYNSNPSSEIIIPYGLRTSIDNNGIIFHKPGDEITNGTSPNQLEIPFDMKLDYDDTNFIIRKPGDPTQCIKIAWGPS
jgi:hypothetical protein